MCDVSVWWFTLFIVALLTIDLLWHKKDQVLSFKQAMQASAFWISLALLFNVWVYFCKGQEIALQFLAGYLVEQSLSVDNLFVFIVIFKYFHIPPKYQHKVLFWGVLGAIVFRALFIGVGLELVDRFSWILYLFALFLIYAGIQMALPQKEYDPEGDFVVRWAKKFLPFTHDGEGRFVHKGAFTTLTLALIAVETSDILFALDSIPAVFAISRDPFIVYTSNIFAILGLRSLYFALSGLLETFIYLHWALAAILIFVGFKMLVEPFYHIPVGFSLMFIFCALGVAIGAGYEKSHSKK